MNDCQIFYETSNFQLKCNIKSPYSTCMFIRDYLKSSIFTMKSVPLMHFMYQFRLTYPISVIIYCVSEDFLNLEDLN